MMRFLEHLFSFPSFAPRRRIDRETITLAQTKDLLSPITTGHTFEILRLNMEVQSLSERISKLEEAGE